MASSSAPQTVTTYAVRGDPLSMAEPFDMAADSNTSGNPVQCNRFGLFVGFFVDGIGSFCDFLPFPLL